MKKLAAFFIVLIALIAIVGCNRFKNTNESEGDSSETKAINANTTITKLEDAPDNNDEVVMEITSTSDNQVEEDNTDNSVNSDTNKIKNSIPDNKELAPTGASNLLLSMLIAIAGSLFFQRKKLA